MKFKSALFYSLIITFTTLGLFSQSATAAMSEVTFEQRQLAMKLFVVSENSKADSEQLKKIVIDQVKKDIEAEASRDDLDPRGYITLDYSFENFIADLKSTDFNKMDRAELLVNFLKTEARLNTQIQYRTIPENSMGYIKAVLVEIQPVARKLGINL